MFNFNYNFLSNFFLKKEKIQFNLLGIIAIFLWSTGGVAISFLQSIPSFEVLSISFILIFIFTIPFILSSLKKKSSNYFSIKYIFTILGPPSQQILYIMSYYFAPAEEIDIIIYTWPIFSIFFMNIFLKSRICLRHILSGILGFLGIILISYKHQNIFKLSIGHFLALISAFLWGVYNILIKQKLTITIPMIGEGFGIGACITIILHFYLESFVLPSLFQVKILFYYSLILSLLSFYFWIKSIQRGNYIFLTTIAYFKPILSIFFLILFEYTIYSNKLFMSLILVLFSCLLSNDSFILFLRKFIK